MVCYWVLQYSANIFIHARICSGDYDSAVDMLRMAITLIKQSVTSGTETSQILIQSLQDCLHGIEEQISMAK